MVWQRLVIHFGFILASLFGLAHGALAVPADEEVSRELGASSRVWSNLGQLRAGQRLEVKTKDSLRHDGKFLALYNRHPQMNGTDEVVPRGQFGATIKRSPEGQCRQ